MTPGQRGRTPIRGIPYRCSISNIFMLIQCLNAEYKNTTFTKDFI